MKASGPAFFHQLYGKRKPRVTYFKKDFPDYVVMILLSAAAICASYGMHHALSMVGLVLCALMLVVFVIRHGAQLSTPLIIRRPQEIVFLLLYKLRNLRPVYFAGLSLLLLENYLIRITPHLPHHVPFMHKMALTLFYAHLLGITAYRTVILADHLRKRRLVHEVLLQTPWRRAIKQDTNISIEIVHAYCTGLLTHILLIAPWFLIISYCKFSAVFLPVVAALDFLVYAKWLKAFNGWFYRDHWLGHNSEFEFVFLHGTHHDAIPSALIAVAENGLLEGYLRYTIGSPTPFYTPLIAFLVYSFEIEGDMRNHQYIPAVFPRLPNRAMELMQHSTHHYGPLEPYGIAVRADPQQKVKWAPVELTNSIQLDEELTGFQWDNPTYRKIMSLYDKYTKREEAYRHSPTDLEV